MAKNQMDNSEMEHVGDLLPAYAAGSLDAGPAETVRQHLIDCSACRAELADWERVGDVFQRTATATPTPSRGLLDRAFAKIDAGQGEFAETPVPGWSERVRTRVAGARFARPFGAGLAAAMLAAVLVLTPVRSYAQDVLARFQPQQFVAVPVNVEDLRSLPSLDQFGTIKGTAATEPRPAANAAEASAISGMTVLTPGSLPTDVPPTVSYIVLGSHTGSFTFSAEKARATAQGRPIPPMPANIDGSSLQITVGTAVVAVYGDAHALGGNAGQTTKADAQKAVTATERKVATGTSGLGEGDLPDVSGFPRLVIGQSLAPTVVATGASVPDLEKYILSLPGVSPELANAIRAIGDPTATWPIPIPIKKVESRPVQVQGVNGLAIGDSTGLGSGVIWVKNGIVYGVAGAYKESEILAIANSLH